MNVRLLLLSTLAFALLPRTVLAESNQAPTAARQRTPFEQLSEDSQALYSVCEQTEKAIAGAKDTKRRKELAASLQEGARTLTGDYANLFRAWMWQAQCALVLNEETDARTAVQNMKDLGALDSGNPQILAVVKLVGERDWNAEQEAKGTDKGKKTSKKEGVAASKKPAKSHPKRSADAAKAPDALPSARKVLGLE